MSEDSHNSKIKLSPARARLALNLKKWRANRGLSQHALAIEAGLHHTFVAHIERNVRNPSLDNIEKLAVALKIDIVELLRDPRSRSGSTDNTGNQWIERS